MLIIRLDMRKSDLYIGINGHAYPSVRGSQSEGDLKKSQEVYLSPNRAVCVRDDLAFVVGSCLLIQVCAWNRRINVKLRISMLYWSRGTLKGFLLDDSSCCVTSLETLKRIQ